ncbi:NADP oxidoreductase [Ectothiorhodospiraceae bacterium BW-2]|nr:NADP oxidoreductase [Ectothiorhodospiraceae bacterium BW-2]
MSRKTKVATASLCGCFGCHMSLLDIDERIFDLVELIELERSPLNDLKEVSEVDVVLIEGGVANSDNVELLLQFRAKSQILVAVGACAINGGIPAMRNQFSVSESLQESYLNGLGVTEGQIPDDDEIPWLLNQVHPLHEVVRVDYALPGCPPGGETLWRFLSALLRGEPIILPYTQLHYD